MPRNIIRGNGGIGRLIAKGDVDAKNYIRRVEIADSQFLESKTRNAITDFVIGCKNDGTWDAIKTCCILSGARTLNGALTPLKGTAPTNNNFISSDYNRATGLKGDASTKYLNSNRADNADPQDSQHLSVFHTDSNACTIGNTYIMGAISASFIGSSISFNCVAGFSSTQLGSSRTSNSAGSGGWVGNNLINFKGVSRSNSTSFNYLFVPVDNTVSTSTSSSSSPSSLNIFIFGRNNNGTLDSVSQARIAFYSIGESLNLILLRSRVNALMSIYSTLT